MFHWGKYGKVKGQCGALHNCFPFMHLWVFEKYVYLIVEELYWLVVANIISSDGTNSLKLSYSYINIVNVLERFF